MFNVILFILSLIVAYRNILHLVAEMQEPDGSDRSIPQLRHFLSILSESDWKKYQNFTSQLFKLVWITGHPPLHEVIALLFCTSKLLESMVQLHCHFFAASASFALEEYHTAYRPNRSILWGPFKVPWFSLCIPSYNPLALIYKDALKAIVLFYKKFAILYYQ